MSTTTVPELNAQVTFLLMLRNSSRILLSRAASSSSLLASPSSSPSVFRLQSVQFRSTPRTMSAEPVFTKDACPRKSTLPGCPCCGLLLFSGEHPEIS